VILSLAAATNGDLWVGTPDGLNRIHAGHITTYTSADGLPDDFIRSLWIDNDGSLWIGTRHGLAHWAAHEPGHARVQIYTQANGLGSDLVGAIARDVHGDLWIATLAGLARMQGNAIANFTTVNGLSSNVITALLPHADGSLLVGTQDHGWNLGDGQRFAPASHGVLEHSAIHALLDDGAGHLWLATSGGIARCAGQPTQCIEFDAADGLLSREMAANSHPSAWRGHDGHLWFATEKGLVETDPAYFAVNTIPPPVALEQFRVDDKTQLLQSTAEPLRIAAGHVHFEFDYAALSFIAPQKVRYRYMLEGFDRGWSEAGGRRAAYYTNIPPGRYTFRVQAANNDGLWNTTGAAFSFALRPRFYQTPWFFALLLAALAATVVLLLKMRLYAAERAFKAVLGERSRIAREIHDTLAQGYVGVSVQLEILAQLLRQKNLEALAGQLDKTREIVRSGLADARQSIWALRTQDARETTLPVKLRRMAEETAESGLQPEFSLFGAYRPLPEDTERELLRIAQEAIQNVKKHARAQRLWVQLEYQQDTISLEVRDDGQGGAAQQIVESPSKRFGLTGLKERAAAIGATFEMSSEPGAGTTIRLCAPARANANIRTEGQA
jgi:signal transduction histidine kinase